jgi:hypothetical protein
MHRKLCKGVRRKTARKIKRRKTARKIKRRKTARKIKRRKTARKTTRKVKRKVKRKRRQRGGDGTTNYSNGMSPWSPQELALNAGF